MVLALHDEGSSVDNPGILLKLYPASSQARKSSVAVSTRPSRDPDAGPAWYCKNAHFFWSSGTTNRSYLSGAFITCRSACLMYIYNIFSYPKFNAIGFRLFGKSSHIFQRDKAGGTFKPLGRLQHRRLPGRRHLISTCCR